MPIKATFKEIDTTDTTDTTPTTIDSTTQSIEVCVVGFRFRKHHPRDMNEGVFGFEYEPDNKFDKHAVKVMKLGSMNELIHIGYLSRNTALAYADFNPRQIRSIAVERIATYEGSVMLRLTAR